MNKKIPVLVVGSCVLWLAYSFRELLLYLIIGASAFYSESADHPFPLGEGRKTTLETSWNLLSKPYAVSLKTEFLDQQNVGYLELRKKEYPIDIKLKIYEKKPLSQSKKLIYEKRIQGFKDFDGQSKDVSKGTVLNFLFNAEFSPGKYFFEIEDFSTNSEPYKGLKTSVKFVISNRKY